MQSGSARGPCALDLRRTRRGRHRPASRPRHRPPTRTRPPPGRAAAWCSRLPAADTIRLRPTYASPEVAEQRVLREARRPSRACRESAGRAGGRASTARANISWTRSSGVSSTILISSRITFFSRSISSAGERRPQHQSEQDVDRQRQVLVEHLDVVAGVFLRRERVELAADRIDLLRDVLRGARSVPLKSMCSTKCAMPHCSARFVARPARQPHADAHGAHVRHGLGDEPNAIRKRLVDDHRRWADSAREVPRARERPMIPVGKRIREPGPSGKGPGGRPSPPAHIMHVWPTRTAGVADGRVSSGDGPLGRRFLLTHRKKFAHSGRWTRHTARGRPRCPRSPPAPAGPTDLAELTPDELEALVVELGGEAFHGRQIFRWIYGRA